MRRMIPRDRLDQIQYQLVSVLSQPSAIPAGEALPFLSNYARDLAGFTLDSTSNSTAINSESRSSMDLQDAALRLLEHHANSAPKGIPLPLIIDAMVVYSGSRYHSRIQVVSKTILDAVPPLSQEIIMALQTATQSCFGPRVAPLTTLKSLHRAVNALTLVLHTGVSSLVEEFTGPNNVAGIRMLVQIYDQLLPSIATALAQSSRPIAQTLIRGDAEWAREWLHIKILILDILQSAFSFVTPPDTGSENSQRLAVFASTLAGNGPPPEAASSSWKLLVDSPLLTDYERLFQFSGTLRAKGWTDGGPTAAFATLAQNIEIDQEVVGVLTGSNTVLDKTPVARTVALPPSDPKGKGKGRAVQVESDPAIEEGLNMILGILPDQDPTFLRRCLAHPNYRGEGGVERLMAALFEGTLPMELNVAEEEEHTHADPVQATEEEDLQDLVRGRANVLDALQMDMSTLRMGKKQDTADELLNDSARQEMKAAILRLAQDVSNEEEDTRAFNGPGRHKLVPFDEDEFDDEFERVSVVGDGETSDGEEDETEDNVSLLIPSLSLPTLRTPDYSTEMQRQGAPKQGRYYAPKQAGQMNKLRDGGSCWTATQRRTRSSRNMGSGVTKQFSRLALDQAAVGTVETEEAVEREGGAEEEVVGGVGTLLKRLQERMDQQLAVEMHKVTLAEVEEEEAGRKERSQIRKEIVRGSRRISHERDKADTIEKWAVERDPR
ncbi:hypothetical protein M408DRAFT_329684, partial [Serendipita vermifera MAFF 305830]